ncbi:MAG: hypothetical protein JWO87_1489 [Phycisphaerales bacterium]|nr:hypothetical protein [Phycisphaerales bacterium]
MSQIRKSSRNNNPKKSSKDLTASDFVALSNAEKERIFQDIEKQDSSERLAQSRPFNARERARWQRFKKKMGRPRVGKGAKLISVTVEKGLLERADAYAKEHGLKRAQMIAQGLLRVIGEAPVRRVG